jgi:ADP-heptose:LPS heptosyltransferase
VIRLGAVGDVVRTLPSVSSLRAAYPGSTIAWLVEPASASAVEGQPWVDEVILFPRGMLQQSLARWRLLRAARIARRFLGDLRRRRFDLVLDFHSILKSGVLARLSGAPTRASYARPFAREGAFLFATARARMEPTKISRFERNEGLVRFLGLHADSDQRPLRLEPEILERAAKGLGPGPAPVAIHPGTSDATPHKRYTVAGYAAVARALADGEGMTSVVSCGPARDDRAFAAAIVEASGGAARIAPETPTLADLAALFSRSRLYIGGDTGPMHVASLVGTPVVQILGPTDPVENAPFPGSPSRTVRVQIHCNPCRRGCAAVTCMRVIPPEMVIDAARELLATTAAGVGARRPLRA